MEVVLIETLWNVKKSKTIWSAWTRSINRNIVECKVQILVCKHIHTSVLIETLWNVKVLHCHSFSLLSGCINRNIVECKGSFRRVLLLCCPGINRNIVECKVASLISFEHCLSVLIETLWNVKIFDKTFIEDSYAY